MSSNCYGLQDPSARLNDSIELLYVTRSRYGADWHSIPHTHYFTELFYVISGEGSFQIEDMRFNIHPDQLIIVNPTIEHTELSQGNQPLEYFVVGLSGQNFVAPGSSETRYVKLSCAAQREEYLFYFKAMMREMTEKEPSYEAVCHNLAEVLVAKLMRQTIHSNLGQESRKSSKECLKAQRYMDEHFKENVTLDILSELTHMNKYYLVHAFKRELGCSPINYLINRRIRESEFLLKTTDYSVSQISQQLGFSSPSYFSQSFKKIVGIGPSEYRSAAQKEPSAES